MKTNLKLAVLALFASAISAQLSATFAQGNLTPPGAPTPTMKSLNQIYARTDSRIAITNSASAVTISAPGSYYLTTNLTVSSGDAITIATNGVTLDLNGYTISSTAASATGNGILLQGSLSDITIDNGHIRSGVTNNGSGTYTGSGFGYGIAYSGFSTPVNVLVSRVSVSGCLYYGIYLGIDNSTVVENSLVRTVGSYGVAASVIRACVSVDCGGAAIFGDQVSDSRGESVGSTGMYANTTALNCYGKSNGNGYGLYAINAQNCYGYSSSSYGLFAATVQNCYGFSESATGLYGNWVFNCFGNSNGNGYGLYATKIAQNCSGYSNTGIGLSAFIASVCNGITSSGTALSTSHNVNSF